MLVLCSTIETILLFHALLNRVSKGTVLSGRTAMNANILTAKEKTRQFLNGVLNLFL